MSTSKPLEIFLFSGCTNPLGDKAATILLKTIPFLKKTVSSHAQSVAGKEMNIVITNGSAMRAMNKKFRKIDGMTDVLAFPLDAPVLGEVWLCPSVIRSNAVRFNQPFDRELVRVLIHGLLHLAGYDHMGSFLDASSEKEIMFATQEKILSEVQVEMKKVAE